MTKPMPAATTKSKKQPKQEAGEVQTASKSRKSWPIILLIVLALLFGLFVLGDHLARKYAERRVMDEMRQVFEETSVARIDAELGGWPFLFSLIDKNIKSGHAEVDDLKAVVSGSPVRIVTGSLDFENFHPFNDVENATVGTLKASATLDWETLNAQAPGIKLSHESGNRLQAVTAVEVFGVPIEIKVSGEVRIQNPAGSLFLVDPKAEVAGVGVPDSIVQGVIAQVQDQLKLPALPGLSYNTVGVSAQGASVSVSGHNVKLADLK